MKKLIENVINKDFDTANKTLEEGFQFILEKKMYEMKKMYAAKMSEQDEIDEGLLKVARDKLKLMSPTARANMEKPVMRNISGKPLGGQKLKIAPKKLEEEESGEESSMARSELQAITKDAKIIMSKIKGNKELEAWTQSKITKAADYMNAVADYMEGDKEELNEAPRVGIVKLRVRGGQVQRRKKVSNVAGMTIRGGQLTKMSPAERRRRKLGAKVAARKAKSKRTQMLRKRKISLLKRQRMGG